MRPRYIYVPFIPSGKNAVTIYPYIIWSKRMRAWERPEIVAHEMYHWDEQAMWKRTKHFGAFRWLTQYVAMWLWLNFLHGANIADHPMEREAYRVQNEFLANSPK